MSEHLSSSKPNQSVADRVLSVFIASVQEDEDLAEIAPRLRAVLLGQDSINEIALRKALFRDDAQ